MLRETQVFAKLTEFIQLIWSYRQYTRLTGIRRPRETRNEKFRFCELLEVFVDWTSFQEINQLIVVGECLLLLLLLLYAVVV